MTRVAPGAATELATETRPSSVVVRSYRRLATANIGVAIAAFGVVAVWASKRLGMTLSVT